MATAKYVAGFNYDYATLQRCVTGVTESGAQECGRKDDASDQMGMVLGWTFLEKDVATRLVQHTIR